MYVIAEGDGQGSWLADRQAFGAPVLSDFLYCIIGWLWYAWCWVCWVKYQC